MSLSHRIAKLEQLAAKHQAQQNRVPLEDAAKALVAWVQHGTPIPPDIAEGVPYMMTREKLAEFRDIMERMDKSEGVDDCGTPLGCHAGKTQRPSKG